MSKLTSEQKDIIKKIESYSNQYGIDPDYAIAIANLESSLQNVPASDEKSTAFGPFQVNKATAQANGVDYDEMRNDRDLAIKTGILNLVRHSKNPIFEGDPARIAAAHRYGENSEYAKTGDVSKIDKTLASYLANAMEHFPESQFPSTVYTGIQSTNDSGDTESKLDMGSKPLADYSTSQAAHESSNLAAMDRNMAAALGAAAGSGIGTVYSAKSPIVRMAHRVGLLPGGKPISTSDAAALVEQIMNAEKQVPPVPSPTPQLTPTVNTPPSARRPTGGENWQKSLTGVSTPNAQMDKASLDLAKGMQQAIGIKGEPGFTGGAITEGGIIVNPQDALFLKAKQQQDALKAARLNELQQNASMRESEIQARLRAVMERKALEQTSLAQKALQKTMPNEMFQHGARMALTSAPIKGALIGAGIGYNAEDAYDKYQSNDYLGSALSAGAAGASGLSVIPKLARVMGPAAVALTTGSQMLGDIRRGDKQAAAETGLTGLTSLLPRTLGPYAAALYSRGLNEGEADELERRRRMQPTIYSGTNAPRNP